jgi:hypothetical protein
METTSSIQPGEVRVSEFGLVAALVTSGFGIRRTERDGRRVLFIFENTDTLAETTNDYWAGNLKVYARQYFDNTKMLKGMIYGD